MPRLIKICGLKTEEAASTAVETGANLLGIILVPNRKRTIDHEVAKKLSDLVRRKRHEKASKFNTANAIIKHLDTLKFSNADEYFGTFKQLIIENGPFLVGVFRNQEISQVFEIANELNLDFIQLHGDEDKGEFYKYNEVHESLRYGIVSRFVIPKDIELMNEVFGGLIEDNKCTTKGYAVPLLDSELGGEGKVIDWGVVNDLKIGKFILAGGLTPDNVHEAFTVNNVIGYDVSGGVEDSAGNKNLKKVEAFINVVKQQS